MFGDKHWHEPMTWNKQAQKNGQQWRVFWNSMSDICEDRRDLDAARSRAWDLMEATPYLTHMLLSKRPQNYQRLLLKGREPLPNQWFGATVGVKASLWRAAELLKIEGAKIRWLSVEPLLEELDLSPYLPGIHYIVCGGESTPGCRPMDIEWARLLLGQCRAAGAKFFMKQLGGWPDKRHNLADFPADLQIQEYPEVEHA